MPLKEKINLKIYLTCSVFLLVLAAFFCNGPKEFMATAIVFVAVVLNQWMLLNTVDALIASAKDKDADSPSNIVLTFLSKAIILIVAITFGVHIMGNRIIIPILIYIAQIFVLYFSMDNAQKKNEK